MIVKAKVGRRITELVPPYPNGNAQRFYSYRPKGYFFDPKFKYTTWDGTEAMLVDHRMSTGLFLATKDEAEKKMGVEFKIEKLDEPVVKYRSLADSDREYQMTALRKMKEATPWSGGLILSATGTGKTRIAAMLCQDVIGKAVFIVDELTLLDQARTAVSDYIQEPVGIVGKSEFNPSRVTIATIQTLDRHKDDPNFKAWVESTDIAFIDEIHVALNKRQIKIMDRFVNLSAVFGLTATLPLKSRTTRMQAYALAGPVIYQYDLQDGIGDRVLTPGVVIQLGYANPNASDADADTQYWPIYAKDIANNPERNDLIIETVKAAYKRGRAIVLILTMVKHVTMMAERLQAELKVRVGTVYGSIRSAERHRSKEEFDSGQLDILVCNKVFKKGIDLQRVNCIIDGSAAASKQECLQGFGRGVRVHKDKRSLIHIDIGDRCGKFAEAANNRRSAFGGVSVPVFRVAWTPGMNMKKVIRRAEELADGAGKETDGNGKTNKSKRTGP